MKISGGEEKFDRNRKGKENDVHRRKMKSKRVEGRRRKEE